MTADLNNYIVSVSYNSLNLPSNITYANGSHIDYTYSSTGEKVCTDYYNRVKVNIVRPTITATTGRYLTYYKHTNTEYCGNHIFENGKLKQTLFDGGFVTYSDGEPEYHFYVRDHQGNNRLVMNEDGIVEQVNDYTPFGVQMKNSFAETSDQRYKYNGKELDRMLGLDLYDYGARFYDARIARWQTIDPLCEKYYAISPYAYCANNPIRFIDPDGKDATICIMDNNITIAVNIYIYGSGATSEIAKTMQQDIMKFWGKNADTNTNWTYKDNKTKKEYNVTFDVNVKLYDKENPSSIPGLFSGRYNPFNRDNYIEVTDTDRSYVSGAIVR
jgi:RHS repeat-associated protein